MNAPSNSIYAIVAALSVAMAACQPGEDAFESLRKDADSAAKKVDDNAGKSAAKRKTIGLGKSD